MCGASMPTGLRVQPFLSPKAKTMTKMQEAAIKPAGHMRRWSFLVGLMLAASVPFVAG
jgi:hypothetical protein